MRHGVSGIDELRLGRFVILWRELEELIKEEAATHHLLGKQPPTVVTSAKFLHGASVLDDETFARIVNLSHTRNLLLHGEAEMDAEEFDELLSELQTVCDYLKSEQ